MAVTSAPAPAPWMMSGRGEYLLVSLVQALGSGSLPGCSERDDVIRALESSCESMVEIVSDISFVRYEKFVTNDSLAQLGLYLSSLDIYNTNISNYFTFLPSFLP
jgi:hypothetical protein